MWNLVERDYSCCQTAATLVQCHDKHQLVTHSDHLDPFQTEIKLLHVILLLIKEWEHRTSEMDGDVQKAIENVSVGTKLKIRHTRLSNLAIFYCLSSIIFDRLKSLKRTQSRLRKMHSRVPYDICSGKEVQIHLPASG